MRGWAMGLALVAAGCGPSTKNAAPPPSTTPDVVASFHVLRDRIVERSLDEEPEWARELGLHERDGKVAKYAMAEIQAQIAWRREAKDALEKIDARALSADDALDLAILDRMIAGRLFKLVRRDQPRKLPQFYEPLFDVEAYLDREYAPIEARAEALVAQEEAALTEVAHVRENLALPLSKVIARVAAKNFAGYAEYLRGDVKTRLAKVGDAAFQARLRKANDALAKEAEELARWLRDDVSPKGDDSHVLGPDVFHELIEVQEGLTITLDAFEKDGEADLAKNRAAWEALSKTTKVTRPAVGELLAAASKMKSDARAFLVAHEIVTLPTDDDAIVQETPPFLRWNQAWLSPSGPFEKARSAFFYITLPDPSWPKKEQEEYVLPWGVLRATTVHEVYPGHFVQGRWAERAPTRVQKMAASYSFGEGWAHYAEQMMIEEGFGADDPQNKLGQITDALLRDCRYLVALGVHAKGMTIEAATRRFVDDCKQPEAEAREQAERGTFDPGYFAYTLGKLQILALRDEVKRKLGASFSLRRFHDALLAHGAAPVALLRPRVLADLGATP